jgi:hypothetical protein
MGRSRASCRRLVSLFLPAALAGALATAAAGCKREIPEERRYYDLHIQPIFDGFCVGNTSPCHKVDPATGTALGNLDLTSLEAVHKRRDVLRSYGAYPQPLLLLKSIPEAGTLIPYGGKLVQSEIRHAGGKPLSPSSDAFYALKRWLDGGATRDGIAPPSAPRRGTGPCTTAIPRDLAGKTVDSASAAYQRFIADVEPVLHDSCAFATCHSSPQADFFVTCGADDAQRDANFLRAAAFVAAAPASVEQSELLLRPLDARAGGVNHTGGVYFPSRETPAWKKVRDFAAAVQADAALNAAAAQAAAARSPGERFFGERVMPVLVARGCAIESCHSPSGFNDYRLRPGAPGFLSSVAVRRNYETSLLEFMSLDTPDVRQSRLVKKNILKGAGGIVHRGGALLEGPTTSSRDLCPTPFDAASASAFCTIKEWHRIERADHAATVSSLAPGSTATLAFVARPPDGDSPLEFDTFRGGADLKLADAALGADGRVESIGMPRSALGPCAGLAGLTDLDVRGPEWSHDGQRLAFAARAGADSGLDLWVLDVAAGSCRRVTSDNGRVAGAVRVHNFDPVFAPDGGLVFASTRAGTLTLKRFLPNADLFRIGPSLDASASEPERMTYLLNSELAPAFMQNGQVTFTAEKASPNFYQLSGRRINWDLTDYHPLLGQRARSDDRAGAVRPSLDYQQATEIREALDRNFIFIASDATAKGGGGMLATFNRSLGPFEAGRNEPTFLQAVENVDPTVTGRPGTRGVYRSPFSLPNGEILASFAANVTNPAADTPRYDLVAVDPGARARRMLLAGGAQSLVEAALGYRRSTRQLFRNHTQLVFGGHGGSSGGDSAVAHFPDLPMLATLLGSNLRRGRNVEALAGANALRVYEARPPASRDTSMAMGTEQVWTERRLLGSAPLESDGSLKVVLPAKKALVLELVGGDGQALLTMEEEHQMGPGEVISPGVPRKLFDGVCGGCHGSRTGQETDVAVTADSLTGASVSLSRDGDPKPLR